MNNLNTLLFLMENSDASLAVIEHWMEDVGMDDVVSEDCAFNVLSLFEQHLESATGFYLDGKPYFGEVVCKPEVEYIPRDEFWGISFPAKKVHYCVWVDVDGNELHDRKLELLDGGQ